MIETDLNKAGLAFLTFLWAYFRLPETKDRSFAEIDYMFVNKVKTRQFPVTQVDTFEDIAGPPIRHVSDDLEQ